MRRTRTLLLVIGAIGVLLALVRAFPSTVILMWILPPTYFLTRRLVRTIEGHEGRLTLDDRLAAFLAVSIFTVPLLLVVLFAIVVAVDGL